jgi:hypothetical protein
MRRPMRRIGKRQAEYFAVAQLLCLERNIGNLSVIQEEALSLGKRGSELFVGKRDEEVRTSPRKLGDGCGHLRVHERSCSLFAEQLLNNRLQMRRSGATEEPVMLTKQMKMGLCEQVRVN